MSQKLSVMEGIEQMQKDMAIVESIVNDTIGEQKAAEDELQASYSPVDEDSWTSVVVSDTDDKQPRLYTTPVEEMTDAEKSMVISDFAQMIRDLHKETITLADIGPIATVIKDNRGLKQNVEEFIKNAILQSAENQDNAKYARAGQSTGLNMVEGKPAPTEADAKVASPATGAGAFGAASVGAPEGMTADAPVPAPAEEPAPEVDSDAADLAAVPGIDGGSDFEEAPITSLGGDLAPTDEVKEEVPAEAEPVEEVPAVDAPVTDETTPIDEPAPAEEAPAEEAAPAEEEETAVEETEETEDGEKKEEVEEEDDKVFECIKSKMNAACKGNKCASKAPFEAVDHEKALRARLEAIAADYHRKEERKKLLESAINNAKKSIRESSEEKKRAMLESAISRAKAARKEKVARESKRAAIAKAINEAREAISKEKVARGEKDKAAKRAAIAKAINEAREENAKRAAIAEAIAKAKRSVMEGNENAKVEGIGELVSAFAEKVASKVGKKSLNSAVSNIQGMPKSGLVGGGVKELNADYVKKAEAIRKARIAQAVADAKSKKFELDLTKKKLMEAQKRFNAAVAKKRLENLQNSVKEQGMKNKILDGCDD